MKTTIIFLVLAVFASGPAMAGEIAVDGSFPIVGEPMVLSVSDVGRPENHTLRVVYAPNSETQTVEEIGRLSADGTIAWNPERFGIATLTVTDDAGSTVATENVAILPAETPAGGVLVMIFAGILLFGGAGWSLRSVLASGVPEQLPPKDT
jgi:hypothetical protein